MTTPNPNRELALTSAVSERLDTREAVREAANAIRASAPGGQTPDLVLAFVSPHHAKAFGQIGAFIREELGETTFLGGSAAGVIGAGRELESREAISLTAAFLPDARLVVHHISDAPGDGSPAAWAAALGARPDDRRACLVLVDPSTCESDMLLRNLDAALPGSCKVGGQASPIGDRPAALFSGARVHRGGALVCLLDGAFDVTAVVARACRPIGEAFIVTRSRGNVIQELNAGKPAEVLRMLHESLGERDNALWNTSLFLGVDMTQTTGTHKQGDFVIRNVLGVDRESGAMAIDCNLQSYQVVQFHLRDRETATADLTRQLRTLGLSDHASRIRGALLFSGVGRGERLFGMANHDSDEFLRRVGAVSLSGFFCNGEIGPVGERNFLHGYTSVYAVFSAR